MRIRRHECKLGGICPYSGQAKNVDQGKVKQFYCDNFNSVSFSVISKQELPITINK